MAEDRTARAFTRFGNTLIDSTMMAQGLIAIQMAEDDYEETANGHQERDTPYAELFFVGLTVPIQVEGEDYDALKAWLGDKLLQPRRVELAEVK